MDFYNKLVVSITLVLVTIFCIFENFSQASENVDLQAVNGVIISHNSNFFVTGGGSSYGTSYFEVEPGYIYKVSVSDYAEGVSIAFGNSVPALNEPYYERLNLKKSEEYSFIVPYGFEYVYFYGSWSSFFTVTKERVGGMDNTVQLLADSLKPDNLWQVFEKSIPYIAFVAVVGFGTFLIFRMIKGLSKGKARM